MLDLITKLSNVTDDLQINIQVSVANNLLFFIACKSCIGLDNIGCP